MENGEGLGLEKEGEAEIRMGEEGRRKQEEMVKMSLSEGSVRPSDLLAQFKQAGPRTKAHIWAAEVLDNTVELIREMVYTNTMTQPNITELLSVEDVETLLQASGCSAELRPPVCATDCLSQRYRTITGECNNRQHPLWGAANTPYTRWLPPEYEDGRAAPRGWDPQHAYHNFTLPPVRSVSQVVLYTQNEDISMDASLSHLLVEWGQWLDHDLTLTPQSPSTSTFRTGADCTRTCSRDTPCFPIQIPLTDPRSGSQSCMPFFRSAPSCVVAATPLRHREQLNAITSFVDASMVYGSSASLSAALRNLSSPLGLLALNPLHADGGLAYMPYLPRPPLHPDPCGPCRGGENCTDPETPAEQANLTSCFQAGDSRANEHLGMIALHTLFLREHNRLAGRLHLVNPHWGPETLYQEARKIVGAVHQVLTWDRYLPRVLGEIGARSLLPPYRGYGAEADPSIANAFSTAAFRFAHVTVQPRVARLGPGYAPSPEHPPLPLHRSLFASWRVVQQGGIDPVLRGLLFSPAKLQSPGQMMVEELTERLFQAQGGLPLDLGALNLQRGRDHGLPGYSAWRQLCNLSVPVTGPDLAQTLGNRSLAQKLLGLYGTPRNIDLWVGAISEPPLPGGRVGPLLACLMAKQFRALRDGDRFWWEREGVFSEAQRAELQRVSLSRIICDNTHIAHVPPDPFARTQRPGDVLPCSHPLIPHLDLSPWGEPDTDPICGAIPRLKFGFSLLCDSALLYRCHDGYRLNGPSSIRCDHNSNQWSPAPPTCQDINECAGQPSPCPQNTECVNTPGSYTCSDGLPSGSVSSLVSAVMAVVGGVAALALVIICYRRFVLKRHKPVIGGCCQRKDQWNGGDHALKEGTSQ
ncbi:eosinophil peroxidase [Anguilla anguilla]|uniref:eosinophil peroxidase n=1 Tax=Anguilla anguilla TaxID=7936 RepID=UPI0015A7C7C7|nr:eosinophil peroxidase [Anguilla anguilla]